MRCQLRTGLIVSCLLFIFQGMPLWAADAPVVAGSSQTLVIDDYEHSGLTNALGGDSGSWNLDPDDLTAYAKEENVATGGAAGSKRCLKLSYSLNPKKDSQCGFWTKLKNADASNYDVLQFDVRGDAKEGFTTEFRVELKKYKDQQTRKYKLTGMKTVKGVTDQWQTITIPLNSFNGLYDKTQQETWDNPRSSMRNLDEFVIVLHNKQVNKMKGVLYFDNIRMAYTGKKYPSVFDRPAWPEKDKSALILEDPAYKKELLVPSKTVSGTYDKQPCPVQSLDELTALLQANPTYMILVSNDKTEITLKLNDKNKISFADFYNYKKFLVTRLRNFPTKTIVKKQFPADDTEMLKMVARDTWACMDGMIDKAHGLPLDTICLSTTTPLGEGGWIGDYTNVTNIGVYLCCVVAANDLGFITRDEAVERINITLNTVKNMETSKWGFPYNYYDTTWGNRTEYFVSLVDSGWLEAGMIVVRNAFPKEVGPLATSLINRGNFKIFYDPIEQQMWHGIYENMDEYVNYHYGIFYTEPRLTSLISIGKGDVEEAHWFKMTRTFPAEFGWTTQSPKGRNVKKYKNIEYTGGYYLVKGEKIVPSWGGSVFEALMPTLLIDERAYAPKSLGRNDETHVKVTIDYTLNDLKYPVWGMSPSSVPEGGYSEFGVKALGTMGYKPGAVTPHASFLTLEFAPKEAIANIRKLNEGWDCYGEFGFYDAVNPLNKNVAYKYLSLDQGMILMALDNYLMNGTLRTHFQNDPIFKKAKHLLGVEDFLAEE